MFIVLRSFVPHNDRLKARKIASVQLGDDFWVDVFENVVTSPSTKFIELSDGSQDKIRLTVEYT